MIHDFIAERARLLEEGNRLIADVRAMDGDEWLASEDLRNRRDEIVDRYVELLPEVTVARCPDTGTLVRWPIDTAGLDGWFWRYEASARRVPEPLPPRWLAMTGAMRLVEPVEFTPHQAVPGPGVPFVVPRILDSPGVRAVIAEVPVGAHTGWPITYFGPSPPDTDLVNTWGSDNYFVYDDDGNWLGWNQDFTQVSEFDFELADWLRSGKLLWIAPGDDSGSLRDGLDGCPYVDLSGPRKLALVEEGQVRYLE